MHDSDIPGLLDSWLIHLMAEGKSEATVDLYADGIRSFIRWCERHGHEVELTRPLCNGWIASLRNAGLSPATARARQLALRRFSAWCADEGETEGDRLAGLRAPKLDEKIVRPLSDAECLALIKACKGRELRDRRDEAIIRFALESGARAGEIVALKTADVNVRTMTAHIRRGKGGKAREVPFGPQTAQAIDRYLRARRGHRMADTERLWLGERGREFGYDGLWVAMRRRAELAGVKGFHPHRMRHTAATRWLRKGGSEQGLMATAGWRRREMLDRYTRSTTADRAIEEARRLDLGDYGG